MNNSRKGKVEMVIQVLQSCSSPHGKRRKKTHIAQRTRINFSKVSLILHDLKAHGLVKENGGRFVIQEKGWKALNTFGRLSSYLEGVL